MNVPNIPFTGELPAEIERHASRLGYTVAELMWLAAADICTRQPERITFAVLPCFASSESRLIPFPQGSQAA